MLRNLYVILLVALILISGCAGGAEQLAQAERFVRELREITMRIPVHGFPVRI